MRSTCLGMLFAAGLLLVGAQTAWAQTDTTAPTFSAGSVIRRNLYITLSEQMNSNIPPTSAFAVSSGGVSIAVSALDVGSSGGVGWNNLWTITLATHVAPGEAVSVTYTKPSSNPPKDLAGNDLAGFTGTATNNTGWSNRAIADAYTSSDGESISVNFNGNLQTSPQADLDLFSATVDGVAAEFTQHRVLNPGSLGGKGQVFLELALPIQELQRVTVSYNRPAGETNPLLDAVSNPRLLRNFTRAVTNKVGPTATIDLVRIVSAPTYDADSDGVRDTYVKDDKILVDVEYSVPVKVTGRPRLRLQLGDDATPANNRKQVNFESELHGGRTLRFAYTVAAADTDTTGVWIETAGSNKTVVFLPGTATIKSATTGEAAELTRTGLSTTGDANAKVDGSKTATDTGPLPTGATVNGARLEVTYDSSLDTSVDTSKLPLYFSVQGTSLSGGNRNAYQHPSTVSFVTSDNTKLVLTLGEAARAGDTVTLTYEPFDNTGQLKDTDDKTAPAFVKLAVTNNTAGTVGPAPSRAAVRGRTLQLVFDGDLDKGSTPAGSAFEVETDDLNGDKRAIAGTGTATVSGATVTVALDENEEPVGAKDLVSVSYTPPTSKPLQNAGGNDVLAFERFRVERVIDSKAPTAKVGLGLWQTQTTPVRANLFVYFDEAPDASSVPAATDFSVTVGGTAANISLVTVAGFAVSMTIDRFPASNITETSLSYTPGTNPIRDAAGNITASFTRTQTGWGPSDKPSFGFYTVDGSLLTLTAAADRLDPHSTPAAEAFTLHYPLATGEMEADRLEYTNDITSVAIDRNTVSLRLAYPVRPCDGATPFTVTYTKPSESPIQSVNTKEMDGFTNQAVTNRRSSKCTRSQVKSNSGRSAQGKSVTLSFDRTLDTARALKASAFRLAGASGGSAPSVAGASYADDASGVLLTLGRVLEGGETVTVSYQRAALDPGLWDTEGHQIADFSGVTVTAPEAPAVSGVEVVSDAGEDDTYALGETIRVRVTFDEAVDVTGAPRLKIDMDPAGWWGEKWAAYESGSGAESLTFAYEVVQPNLSTQGIAVLADTLQANGGAIRSAATGTDAQHGHDGLGHDPAHKVDWRLAPAAAGTVPVTGVEVVSDAGEDDTYALGETVRVRVTFGEAVEVDTAGGAPRLRIDMDPAGWWGEKWAAYEGGSGTESLTFAYEVVQPNLSTQGIAVLADTLEANGGTIRSASTGTDAHLSHTGLGHDPAHKVDWRPDAASVIGVSVSSSPASGDTYALGETIRVTLTFDEAVTVTGAPRLTIDMDPAHWGEKLGTYEGGSGTGSLVFAYQVVQPNLSTQGIAVPANSLALGDGAIRSTATGTAADLSHAGLGHDAAHKVDWRSGLASVTAVRVSSTPASGDTYLHGETIRVTVAFDKAVTVTGAPRLKIDMDRAYWGEKLATYEGGSGTGSLTFAHTVVEPNLSTQGIAVLANSLALGGGVIHTAGTSLDADLAHTGLGHDPAHKVDWRPTLSVADAEAHEGQDAAMEFAVTLSRPASGAVTVDYATGDGTATAGEDYTATSGTLTFAAGEQAKTVSVPLLDDAIDEGKETFTLTLSNPSRARILDGEATGTIINSDHMPKAWTSRFGRTVAVHVVDAVEARLEGASDSYLQVGGQRLGGGAPPDVEESARRMAPERDLWEEPDTANMPGQDMTVQQLLLGSAFHLVSEPGEEPGGPRLSAWGRVASSGFDGREDKLSLDGTVTTATLGVDGVWKRWLSGLLLAYSEGDGSFTHLDMPGGDVSSSLTSLHPYVAYTLSDRVRLWGTVGYGSGALQLRLEDQRALDTDLTMTMGAVGVRGSLLRPSHAGGLHLDVRSDVLWMVMDSAKADNLAATEAEASRLRLVLEGSRPVALAGGGSFTPSLEIGLRHDGGDAETGTGVEVGGSLRYASAWGLSIEASLRALVAHEEQDYREWGASGALRFDPGRQGRGLTAAIVPTWGTASSGISRLWDQPTAAGLAPDDPLAQAAAEGRLEAELGYGLVTLKGRALLTPYARVALGESADQAWHLGTRLALAESLNLSVEASRRQREGDVAAHELALRAVLGW